MAGSHPDALVPSPTDNNVQTKNASTGVGNGLLEVPTALLEHIHGSRLPSGVTSDKSSDNNTANPKPLHIHVGHAGPASDGHSGNQGNRSDGTSVPAKQSPHPPEHSIAGTKAKLDSSSSPPVGPLLAAKETKGPGAEQHTVAPAPALLGGKKWGFGDKYLGTPRQLVLLTEG